MKRVIYHITDHHKNLSYIDYHSSIEAYDENGVKIDNYKHILYTGKQEIINALIEQYKNDLSAFGIEGTEISLNRPFYNGNYNRNLFEISDNPTEPIKGFKGLCGILCGTIRYPDSTGDEIDVTLEIRSRFDEPGKPWFLYTMLSEALDGNDLAEDAEGTGLSGANDFDLYSMLTVFLFSRKLKTAYESGIYRTYVKKEYNNDRLRGSIDIARHIRQNINSGTINAAYSTRERNENNMLNRLIVHAWNALKRDFPNAVSFVTDNDTEFQRAVNEIISVTCGSMKDIKSCIAANVNPITSPFYMEYEELRQLCLLILADESGAELNSDNDEKLVSILFYIPDLWEKFLERRIRKVLPDSIKMKYQSEQYVYSDPNPTAKRVYRQSIRPDYVFFHGDNPIFVLDAKFKCYSLHNGESEPWMLFPGKSNDDNSLADFDKLLRDMLCHNTSAGGVIYPYKSENKISNSTEDHRHILSEYNKAIYLYHFPLYVPPETAYNKWYENLNKNIDILLSIIKGALESTDESFNAI